MRTWIVVLLGLAAVAALVGPHLGSGAPTGAESAVGLRDAGLSAPISYLPLAGTWQDEVTGGQVSYARASIAFGRDGAELPADTPRTELFAVEAGRTATCILPDVPGVAAYCRAADGLLYGAAGTHLYSSPDGATWTPVADMPGPMHAIFATQAGSVLVSTGRVGQTWLYHRPPGGGAFQPVLEFEIGYSNEYNFVETADHLFVSEYGPKNPPNSRRIYRSADDGATWEVVYDPEYRHTHDHRLCWDPVDDRVMQTTGDGYGNSLWIVSDDQGDHWHIEPLHYPTAPPSHALGGPTGMVPRADALHWALDTANASGVRRQERTTNRWESVLHLGPESEDRYDMFHAQAYDMAEWQGVMYFPANLVHSQPRPNGQFIAPALYTSADGEHWALSQRYGPDEAGLRTFLGAYDGDLWVRYQFSMVDLDECVIRLSPPAALQTLTGTRLEGPVENLWDSADSSSGEGTLTGWAGYLGATVTADPGRALYGQQSVHVVGTAAQRSGVQLPVHTGALSAGTRVSALAHVYGVPRALWMRLYDDTNQIVGELPVAHHSQRWARAFCSAELPRDTTTLTVRLYQQNYVPDLEFWVDGIMLSVGMEGDTWQVGGSPRAGDQAFYDFAFPAQWSDLFLWVPDSGTDAPGAPMRTLKVYQAADGRTLSVQYDPVAEALQLVDSSDPSLTVQTPCFLLAPHAVVRVGVVQAGTTRTLYAQIAEAPYVGTGDALPFDVVRMYFGADPAGTHPCGGLQARHRLYGEAADATQLEQLFIELISLPARGATTGGGAGDAEEGGR